jgi:hypothetical protein
MEVFGFLEVALCISDVIPRLYDYISAVKSAREEIRKLTQELFALRGAVEHFQAQKNANRDSSLPPDVQGMLRMARDTLETILKKLGKPPSRIGRAVEGLVWPLSGRRVRQVPSKFGEG